MSTVLAFSCTHIPYDHPDALDFLLAVKAKFGCDRVVHLGDLIDSNAVSRHTKDPAMPGASDEINLVTNRLEKYKTALPEMQIMRGNHDERIMNCAKRAYIPREYIRPFRQVFKFPARWILKNSCRIDNVFYEHGDDIFNRGVDEKTGPGNLTLKRGVSTVAGHVHTAGGCVTVRDLSGVRFGLFVGCLVDETSPAFDYAGKETKWKLGCGVVFDGRYGMFVPMRLGVNRRWVGTV